MSDLKRNYNKERYHRRREAGLCVACGKPALGKSRCPKCAKAVNAASVVSNRKRIKREREELLRLRVLFANLQEGESVG